MKKANIISFIYLLFGMLAFGYAVAVLFGAPIEAKTVAVLALTALSMIYNSESLRWSKK